MQWPERTIYLSINDWAELNIPHIERVVDSTLKLICRDGLFVYGGGGGCSCEDMEAVDILIRCSLSTKYREDEIKKSMIHTAAMLSACQSRDGGFSWRIQPKINDFFKTSFDRHFFYGKLYDHFYKALHRSHYKSTYYYSSLNCYPFKINQSDMWSSWFRPLTLVFIAKRYPDEFYEPCTWNCPSWPGLGFDPFYRQTK